MPSSGATRVGYDDRGAGPALVLLHPFPFSRTVWAGIADALAVHRRVIAVDARGFGESPRTGPFAIADIADDVAGLLDRLAIARATVLGMSMGGYAALAFATRHRDRLSALVLADTRAAADSRRDPRRAHGRARHHRGRGCARLPRGLPAAPAVAEGPARAGRPPARARRDAAPPACAPASRRCATGPTAPRELGAIACPTLVVCGEDDQVTPAAEMKQIAAAISGARFVPIANAGHLSHIEAPGAFLHAVTSFVGTLGETRAP